MKNILEIFGLVKPYIRIDSKESLAQAAESMGVLPFFPNNIRGLSVEEMCVPGMLFGGNHYEGCWEWKGPVIRKRTTAYGKFFHRKAGFVSLDILPYFLGYRRCKYPIKENSTEEMLYEIIRENDSLTSTELKQLIFGGRKKRGWTDLPDSLMDNKKEEDNLIGGGYKKTKSKSLESPLQRLQMGGWIVISNFEYKMTKQGERYGWGVARYSTPEILFGDIDISGDKITPEESLSILIDRLKKIIPSASKKSLSLLLR